MCFRNNGLPIQEKNGASGILPMSSSGSRKHPHLEEYPVRDYFSNAESSLPEEILLQGLFFQSGIISARRNPPPGIIFPRQMHPCQKKSSAGDYFSELNASLRHNFSIWSCNHRWALCPQSCTDPSRTRRMPANVYQSYLISRRTASSASSAAPEAGAVIPSCAPHYGRNLPVFFAKRG